MKASWLKFLSFSFAGVVATFASGLSADPAAIGQVEIMPTSDGMVVTGFVHGRSIQSVSVDAQLIVLKSDQSGSVRTKQSSTVEILEGESEQFAQAGVSVHFNGTVDIALKISQHGKVIHSVDHRIEQTTGN